MDHEPTHTATILTDDGWGMLRSNRRITVRDQDGNDVTDKVMVIVCDKPDLPEPPDFTAPLLFRNEPLSFLEKFAPHHRGKRRSRRS